MTDRELLELAAKAADEKITWDEYRDYGSYIAYKLRYENEYWNPLYDDGDALRLAMQLHLDIEYGFDTVNVRKYSFIEERYLVEIEGIKLNTEGSVRRAIVQAAAELWKSK